MESIKQINGQMQTIELENGYFITFEPGKVHLMHNGIALCSPKYSTDKQLSYIVNDLKEIAPLIYKRLLEKADLGEAIFNEIKDDLE